jgi:hypothetical protein
MSQNSGNWWSGAGGGAGGGSSKSLQIATALMSTTPTVNGATTLLPVNFDSVDSDTNSTITTGVGWKFTAPVTGSYIIAACITWQPQSAWTAGDEAIMSFTKNVGQTIVTATHWVNVGDSTDLRMTNVLTYALSLTAGDYIQVRARNISSDVMQIAAAYSSFMASWTA